jgi:hypothetical protein
VTKAGHDEQKFRDHLKRLWDLAVEGDQLLAPGERYVDLSTPNPFPARTVWRLKTPATLHHQAAVTLIQDPLLAHAAELMVRSILESYAHLVWIHNGEPASNRKRPDPKSCLGDDSIEGCTQERRALCVELGMAEQQVRNLIYISPEYAPAGTDLVAWQNFLRIKELHDELGCRGRGRTYQDVRPVLAMLKKRGHLSWALDLWIVSSSVVHQLLPERYASNATGTALLGGPASNEDRYKLADWVATVYANLIDAVLSILAPEQKVAFAEMVKHVNERRPPSGAGSS